MDLSDTISTVFASHIEDISATAVSANDALADAGEALVHTLLTDGRVLCGGSGRDTLLAQLFASQLVHLYERERPGLPALALSSDSAVINSLCEANRYADSMARQITTWGSSGDILVLFAGDSSEPPIQAVTAAHERELGVIFIHSGAQADAASLLAPADIEIAVAASSSPRRTECCVVLINCLCELIDQLLFGALGE